MACAAPSGSDVPVIAAASSCKAQPTSLSKNAPYITKNLSSLSKSICCCATCMGHMPMRPVSVERGTPEEPFGPTHCMPTSSDMLL